MRAIYAALAGVLIRKFALRIRAEGLTQDSRTRRFFAHGVCMVGILIAASFLPVMVSAQTAEEKGRAVAVEARRRDTGWGDNSARLLMVLRNRDGDEKNRDLRSRTLEVPNDGNKSVVIFDSPPDVKGTAVLTYAHRTEDDDQWLYLPALKRVKRIGASNKSSPFMGSEFSYEDLASSEVEKYTHRWLRDERCPGQEFASLTCFVVERTPVSKDSGYSRLVVWIDEKEYRDVKVEYYDRKGSLLKTLNLTGYKQYLGRYWRAGEFKWPIIRPVRARVWPGATMSFTAAWRRVLSHRRL